jgi:hypothetical protein
LTWVIANELDPIRGRDRLVVDLQRRVEEERGDRREITSQVFLDELASVGVGRKVEPEPGDVGLPGGSIDFVGRVQAAAGADYNLELRVAASDLLCGGKT